MPHNLKKICRWLLHSFFKLTKMQRRKLNTIKFNNIEDFKVWFIYAAILPLATYVFAFFVNFIFLLNHPCKLTVKNVFAILNNGSLPIIAFGIVSSCTPFLMEMIEIEDKETKSVISELRKKIMSLSVLMLFFTSALYILQSINRDFIFLSGYQEVIIFSSTIVILILSISNGGKMFLLQKDTISKVEEYIAQKGAARLSEGLNRIEIDPSKFNLEADG